MATGKKPKIPNISNALNPDGTANHGRFISGVNKALKAELDGHYKLSYTVNQVDKPGGGASIDIHIERDAVDPNVEPEV